MFHTLTIILLSSGFVLASEPSPTGPLDQGRSYTAWFYAGESAKLWERFAPEMQKAMGTKEGLDALLQAESQPAYLDVRSVRNPATRGRNIRYRVAASPGWNAAFTLVWDNTVVAIAEMQAVIRDAGQFAGLGDARAIGFGRFEVSSFRVVEDRGAKKQTPKRSVAKASS